MAVVVTGSRSETSDCRGVRTGFWVEVGVFLTNTGFLVCGKKWYGVGKVVSVNFLSNTHLKRCPVSSDVNQKPQCLFVC